MKEWLPKTPLGLLRVVLLVGMVAIFSTANGYFLATGNIYSILESFSLLGLVALGLSVTMLAGEFDLSVGTNVAASGLIMLLVGEHNVPLGVAAALGFGLLVGLTNALLTLQLQVSSLVTSLGVMIFLSGLAVWLEGGQGVSFTNYALTDAFNATWLAVASPRSIITFLAFGAMGLLIAFTRLGRDIIAAGSHRKAARMSGAFTGRAICAAFVISGLCSALAGLLLAIYLGRASSQFGANLMLQAATAVILGGVALTGGVGRPSGVIVGVFVLAILNNGLSLIGASSPAILLLNGGMLLLAVLVDGSVGQYLRGFFSPSRKSLN